ncbi:adenine nucleotide alpha hydrolase [Fusarium coicis]|nr:adenine nucleotide alpha hydrolase [Fusarium coicis]
MLTEELEFEFDHSQIRDPRATPGRVRRPRYEEREPSEEFLSKFHIPKLGNKHTDPLHSFYDLHRCHRKGPDGPSTYDSACFQLDYEKVAKWMKPVLTTEIDGQWDGAPFEES